MDKLFDRTKYGVEIEALAVTLADEFIQNLQSKGGIDGAIQKMTEAIAEGQDLLPEVSPELKQRTGKVLKMEETKKTILTPVSKSTKKA